MLNNINHFNPTLAQLVERLTVDVKKSNQIVACSIQASRKINILHNYCVQYLF